MKSPLAHTVTAGWDEQYRPLKWTLGWLAGTFILFLTLGQTEKVPDFGLLISYVTATLLAFTGGYLFKSRVLREVARKSGRAPAPIDRTDASGPISKWVIVSGTWFILFGLFLLREYGAQSPFDVFRALNNSGAAYAAKFDVYKTQLATGAVSLPIQILTILAWLQLPLVPFTVIYWRALSLAARVISIAGISMYSSAFLFQGTLSGLGYLALLAGVSTLLLSAILRLNGVERRHRGRGAKIAIVMIIFLIYMVVTQTQRLQQFNAEDSVVPNPIAARFLPDNVARGVAVVIGYPTQGYLGLSLNLQTPFQWTMLRGSSVALDSYWAQYIGGPNDSVASHTYPARTEVRTGYPAGRKWATIYPWLASDLTFPGTILFMFLVGWLLAKSWADAVRDGNRLACLVVAQLAIFIAFVPANNQLGLSRTSLISTTALLAAYVVQNIGRRLPTASVVSPPETLRSSRLELRSIASRQ